MKFDPAALTRLREAANLSRQALADQAGVSVRTVRRLETRPGDVKAGTIARLARVLGPGSIEEMIHP